MGDEGARAQRWPISDRSAVEEIQRKQILDAVVEVVAERGFAGTSVGLVVARARVSRRTFERLFDGLEDCLTAVLDLGYQRTSELILAGFSGQETWQDGVRIALASLLEFFDSEPLLTRVWLVESQAAGAWAREHRERNVMALRELVLSSWPIATQLSSPSLAAEGVIASVVGIVHGHIVTGKPEPLIELLGPLMGVVASPYLPPRVLAHEIERGNELSRAMLAERASSAPQAAQVDVPPMLLTARAHRARLCLLYLSGHPGVSNQQVGEAIGVSHREQVSRVLGRLAALGLLVKRSGGPGRPNAWSLSTAGEQVARVLTDGR
jgi:AcrR family transcriptional regulator